MEIYIISDTMFYNERNNLSYLFLYTKRNFYDKIMRLQSRIMEDIKFKTNYSFNLSFFVIYKKHSDFKVINTIQNKFTVLWK